jgi:hypothetical protein
MLEKNSFVSAFITYSLKEMDRHRSLDEENYSMTYVENISSKCRRVEIPLARETKR